jgi:iron complex outermembrane receptor protein
VKDFPVASGPYVGNVESYNLVDIGAGYDLGKYAPGMSIDAMVQNVFNNEHREFVGAPKIGRLALARLNYTF